jgi:hypothetical protein
VSWRGLKYADSSVIIAANPTARRTEADRSTPRASPPEASRRARDLAILLGGLALVVGLATAWHYRVAGLTLAHYDAKAHLVVARRIIDSLTPGWQQIGGVWLPLPHLLNLLPVQIDAFYRTGASGVAISVAAFALGCAAAAHIVLAATGSRTGAALTVAVTALNPNLLYLQATPMTEPLLLALVMASVWQLIVWVQGGGRLSAWRPGLLLALACMSRYEAWPVTFVALVASAFAVYGQTGWARLAIVRTGRVALYPIAAIAWFILHSRITTAQWFTHTGFFVKDNLAMGDPTKSAVQVWWGTHQLSGYGLTLTATLAVAVVLVHVIRDRRQASLLIALAPLAAAALPWYAFMQGHPFRIRYMVPLVAASAVAIGLGVGLLPNRARQVGTLWMVLLAAIELRPLDARSPMVVEAQWDTNASRERRQVTACLARDYRGDKILASMGSLAHYMQETSAAGFAIRDYVHEGNGPIWEASIARPQTFVGWILVEERAEGGDILAARGRSNPAFFQGFTRVCEGGGVALYRRRSDSL